MDPMTIRQHLEQAERRAAEGRRLVEHQEALLAGLDRDGHDTKAVRKVLDALRETQALHVQDVRRLLEELEAASQPLA